MRINGGTLHRGRSRRKKCEEYRPDGDVRDCCAFRLYCNWFHSIMKKRLKIVGAELSQHKDKSVRSEPRSEERQENSHVPSTWLCRIFEVM